MDEITEAAFPETRESTETIELRHLGETKSVTRDEAVTLAQKGLDYDRVREKLEAYRRAENRQGDALDFAESHPDVEPGSIPTEVWDGVRRGKTLSESYASYENRLLRRRIEALEQNAHGRRMAAPSASAGGTSAREDEFARWLDEET